MISGKTNLLHASIAIGDGCSGCGSCIITCPSRAIQPASNGKLVVLPQRCCGCLECLEVCPTGSIQALPTSTTTTRVPGGMSQRLQSKGGLLTMNDIRRHVNDHLDETR